MKFKLHSASDIFKYRIERTKIRDGPVKTKSHKFPFHEMRLGQAFWMFSNEYKESEISSMLHAITYVNKNNPQAKFEWHKHKRLPGKDNPTFTTDGRYVWWYEIVRTR